MRKVFIVLAAVALFSASACHWLKPKAAKPNIIVLMVDTLRADHLGYFGYERNTSPVLDAFARENTAYSYCLAASSWTPSSIGSLFTGLYPSAHGMVPPNSREEASRSSAILDQSLLTLAEKFQGGGYQTAAVITNPWMKEDFGYRQGFAHYVYQERVRAEDVHREARRLVSRLKQESSPFFLYLHYMDPHNPYNPPEAFRDLFSGPLQARSYPPRQERYIGLYDGEIRYWDDELGKFLDWLKAENLYDDSIILILSDHGEQFMERGRQGHGFNLYNEELHVPCFLKQGVPAQTVNVTVSLVDMYPTLLELAGIPIKHTIQGISLLSHDKLQQPRAVLAEVKRVLNEKALINSAGKKLILGYPLERGFLVGATEEPDYKKLFDSRQDYAELNELDDLNLRTLLGEQFQQLYQETLDLRDTISVGEIAMDEETIAELESLGYLR